MTRCSVHALVLSDGTITHRVMWRQRLNGATKQREKHFETQRDANRWAAIVRSAGAEAALTLLEQKVPKIVTVSEALDEHLAQLVVKPGTSEEYRRVAARTWLPVLGPMPVHALSKRQVVAWVEQDRRRLSSKTIHNAKSLLSSVMTTAVENGHAVANPVRGVKTPPGEREEKEWLTEDEFLRLVAAMDDWHRPFVILLGTTGLRFGEATALQWRDIDVPWLQVRRTWHKAAGGWELGAPKTRKSRRRIEMPPRTVAALEDVRARSGQVRPSDFVFVGPQGAARIWPSRFTEHSLRPALKKAGIHKRITPHSLRDSHASHLVARGVPLTTVQRRLGHESINTTNDRYVHLDPDLQDAVDATESMFAIEAPPDEESA